MAFTNNVFIHIIFVSEGQYIKDNNTVSKTKKKKKQLIFSLIAFQIYQTTKAFNFTMP